MTEKRFTIIGTQIGRVIRDNETDINTGDIGILFDWLNELNDENEQLQERNNRQAKKLGNIYHLIEKQDWKTLKGIIEEFKECEEQLQKEWKCYE